MTYERRPHDPVRLQRVGVGVAPRGAAEAADLPHQECLRHELQIEPAPAVGAAASDYFGNAVTFFVIEGAHKGLTVRATSTVRSRPAAAGARGHAAVGGGARPRRAAARRDRVPLRLRVDRRRATTVAGYAHPSFPPGRPLLEAVMDLTRRIHEDFTFDPEATTVATPLQRGLRCAAASARTSRGSRSPACARVGLAARYVSGYLETVPPPGAPRLTGADASHAWLAVYCPGLGWIDVDPTNNLLPSTTHVTLAWGRDYGDVSPIRGVILGGGQHSLRRERRCAADVTRLI